jgi:hypothetical protein
MIFPCLHLPSQIVRAFRENPHNGNSALHCYFSSEPLAFMWKRSCFIMRLVAPLIELPFWNQNLCQLTPFDTPSQDSQSEIGGTAVSQCSYDAALIPKMLIREMSQKKSKYTTYQIECIRIQFHYRNNITNSSELLFFLFPETHVF